MTFDVKGSASIRNNTMVNWNHGSGVACFFPFPANNGVSSSTRLLMILVVRKEIHPESDNRHSFMRLLTRIKLTSVFLSEEYTRGSGC